MNRIWVDRKTGPFKQTLKMIVVCEELVSACLVSTGLIGCCDERMCVVEYRLQLEAQTCVLEA